MTGSRLLAIAHQLLHGPVSQPSRAQIAPEGDALTQAVAQWPVGQEVALDLPKPTLHAPTHRDMLPPNLSPHRQAVSCVSPLVNRFTLTQSRQCVTRSRGGEI